MAVLGPDADRDVRRLRVLGDVRHRFGDQVVRGGLDRLGETGVGDVGDLHRERGAQHERFDGRLQAAVGEDDGMDAAGELAKLGERLVELLARDGELGARGARVVAQPRLDDAQPEGERDELLLGAVVKVALDALALGVADLDEARPRGGEPVARVGVGERLRDELGEVEQPPLRVLRQPLGLPGRGGERAPETAADADRSRHGRAEPERAQPVRQRAARALVALDPLGPAAAEHARDDGVAVHRKRRSGGDALGPGLREGGDDHGEVVRAVAHEAHARHAEEPPDLLGDATEQRARGGLARHQRRDPPQRRLLGGERPGRPLARHETLLGLAAFGDVAEGRHDALGPASRAENGRGVDRHPATLAVGPAHARDEPGLRRAGGERVLAEQPLGRDGGAARVDARVQERPGPDAPELVAPPSEDLLGRGVAVGDDPHRVADDESLGHRVHHGPQPLLVGAERGDGPSTLGGDRREDERRERGGRQEQLARQQAVGDRIADERARVVRGVPDGQAGHDDERGRRPAGAEPQCRPDEGREDDVRDVALGRDLRQQDQDDHEGDGLEGLAPAESPKARRRPGQQERRDDERAREVRQPPGPPDLAELAGADDVAEPERGRPEARADDGPDGARDHEREHVADPIHSRPAARQPPQQQRGHDDLERVADGLPHHRPERAGVVGGEQVADHDARPQPRAEQDERGDADADRRPQRGHRPVEVRQAQADLGRPVVERGEGDHRADVQPPPPRRRGPQTGEPLVERGVAWDVMGDRGLQHANDDPLANRPRLQDFGVGGVLDVPACDRTADATRARRARRGAARRRGPRARRSRSRRRSRRCRTSRSTGAAPACGSAPAR
jgi:hypothetical protein